MITHTFIRKPIQILNSGYQINSGGIKIGTKSRTPFEMDMKAFGFF